MCPLAVILPSTAVVSIFIWIWSVPRSLVKTVSSARRRVMLPRILGTLCYSSEFMDFGDCTL